MTRNRIGSVALACLIALTGLVIRPLPARAALAGAIIAINYNGTTITSTAVNSLSIVTNTQNPRKSYIECYFQTPTGQVGLHLRSKDQRRIEAFYQQIATTAAGGKPFQITAYASSTYQTDGYEANLESDLVYLILF